MSAPEGFNAEMMRFLGDAAAALDAVREDHDEARTLMYLGRVEVKIDGVVVGYLSDPDGIAYSYESIRPSGDPR